MAVTEETQSKKRKQPPTFPYLPRDRAQKLKKVWIEKKKLRSKWKAQKRKEGLDSGWEGRAILKGQNEDKPTERENDVETSSDHEALPPSEDELKQSELPQVTKTKAGLEVQRPYPSAKSKGKQPQKAKPAIDDSQTAPSLRDRTRLAYSPSSLHTHKADPLHRQRGAISPSSNRRRGGMAPGADGASRRNARGQPNMKLRMEAMLERIKQDYS